MRQQSVVLQLSGVPQEDREVGSALASKFPVNVSLGAPKRVTHLLLRTPVKRTLKLLHALTRGAWILSVDWARDSVRTGNLLPPEQYELHAFLPGCRRARLRRERGEPALLNGCSVVVQGQTKLPQSDLVGLLRSAGASVRVEHGASTKALDCALRLLSRGVESPLSEAELLDAITEARALRVQVDSATFQQACKENAYDTSKENAHVRTKKDAPATRTRGGWREQDSMGKQAAAVRQGACEEARTEGREAAQEGHRRRELHDQRAEQAGVANRKDGDGGLPRRSKRKAAAGGEGVDCIVDAESVDAPVHADGGLRRDLHCSESTRCVDKHRSQQSHQSQQAHKTQQTQPTQQSGLTRERDGSGHRKRERRRSEAMEQQTQQCEQESQGVPEPQRHQPEQLQESTSQRQQDRLHRARRQAEPRPPLQASVQSVSPPSPRAMQQPASLRTEARSVVSGLACESEASRRAEGAKRCLGQGEGDGGGDGDGVCGDGGGGGGGGGGRVAIRSLRARSAAPLDLLAAACGDAFPAETHAEMLPQMPAGGMCARHRADGNRYFAYDDVLEVYRQRLPECSVDVAPEAADGAATKRQKRQNDSVDFLLSIVEDCQTAVLWKGDKVYAACTFSTKRESRLSEILLLAVRRGLSKRGLGSVLLRAVERRLKENGISHAVACAGLNTVGFWNKAGYSGDMELTLRQWAELRDLFGNSTMLGKKLR